MANRNKAAGTAWETTVVNYLNECDLGAKRTGSAEAEQGDIHAGEWTIEAKAEKAIDLPGYLKQLAAAVERRPEGYRFKSAVYVKNRRHSIHDSYAVMSGQNFRALMLYVEGLEQMVAMVAAVALEGERG